MATEAQIEANRANAQKSTGPRTPEGKAAIAQNAVKHGLRARAAVLHGEDWEEYTGFRAGMLEEMVPDGVQEMELAARIVDLTWRLGRAGRYQDALFEALYDKYVAEEAEPAVGPDAGASVPGDRVLGRMLLADFSGERVLERVQQYERRIESGLARAWADLRQLRCQLRPAAPGRTASGAGRWEDPGGQNHASPSANADSAREMVSSVLPAGEPLRQTKPIDGGVLSLRGLGSDADRPGRVWDLLDEACERQPLWTGVRHPAGLAQAGERRRTGKR